MNKWPRSRRACATIRPLNWRRGASGPRCAGRSRSERRPPACRICGWKFGRPRAFAAQPRIDSAALTLTIGVEAQTRIVPNETKPDCPFPAQLELVPQVEQGRVNIAVPIDIPFTEVTRLLEAQLKGKSFPEDKGGAFTATIRASAWRRLAIACCFRCG